MTLVKKNFRMVRALATTWLLTVACTAVSSAGPVQVIDDRSFFDNFPHTLIDFETRGDGTPLILGPNHFVGLHANEYQGRGIRISGNSQFPNSPIIANLGVSHATEALRLGGSIPNALMNLGSNTLRFEFLQPVNAFGFTILNSPTFGPVELTLFDDQDVILASETFTNSYVHGTVLGEDFGEKYDWNYGFFGIALPDRNFSYATLTEDATALDDFHFGLVPEPTTGLLLAAGLFATAPKRRGYGEAKPPTYNVV